MNYIKKTFCFIALSLLNYHEIKTSDIDFTEIYNSESLSSQSIDTQPESVKDDTFIELYQGQSLHNNSIHFFVVKPNRDGEYPYFDQPYVVKAKVINRVSFLKHSKHLDIIDPIIAGNTIVPQEHFVPCNGPARILSDHEYFNYVYKILYP